MKRFLSLSLLIVALVSACTGKGNQEESNLPTIHTTLFLTYDFAKAIAGDKMHVELFVPAGVDTHTYEPSANDMLKAQKSALFLWTSSTMEPWMPKLIESLNIEKQSVNLADALHLHELNGGEGHDHHDHDHEHHHHHDNDPHFWMNPNFLLPLFDAVTQSIIAQDPDNRTYYETNAQIYREELQAIITDAQEIVATSPKHPLLFGGGFSHQAFLTAYNLPYFSVYASDSIENEPTIAHLATIRQAIQEQGLIYIFVDPMLTTKIATTLAEDYNLLILPWHTGHTLNKEDLDAEVSYLDLLKENNDYLLLALHNQPVLPSN
ncbi:metal ABC transporter substrate-binding protein [Entomospira culicis]|uniref:Zinc ABC transporter substrate-binding protein n=1 Tax=Entomospira culicis TaxID=2719989 RepID=A0A968GHM3_9SPIO|nr:metal ABC transporter substrate-binding protein [Entomospira culicis]NIZ18590.1 zinc ABC transporter substrate-binding protein [Entomospira culicis]NIZ68805.1 zinc ABC transporter substrate-binding protein [Entomospira culicis]WDI37400.1 metal ABC transporter substrate-binding protein [Entomospira culicis]WDI39029.1 metal ABC transporter substrate-binding protein [Entomospira culicis]